MEHHTYYKTLKTNQGKLMHWTIKLIFTTTIISSSVALATITPQRMSTDSRIEVVPYSPYNVVNIFGSTFTNMQVIFAQDEYIENVQSGDLAAWTVSISKALPYTLFVKPTAYNSNTNLTVITNKHTYYLHLTSNTGPNQTNKKITYAIKFIYPVQQRQQVRPASPATF